MFLGIFYLDIAGYAQVELEAMPLLHNQVSNRNNHVEVEVDYDMLTRVRHSESLPLQAGYTIQTNINPSNAGIWIQTPDADWKIWQLVISANHYTGMVLYLNAFNIGEEAKLFVYDQNKENFFGAYNNYSKGNASEFAIQPIYSQKIIIELELPSSEMAYEFNISEIGFVYPGGPIGRGFGDSGDCNVNINCPEGQNWQQQKNGVTRILVKQGSSLYYCSGSLVNNTRNDGTPYLLTANHCGPNSSSADYNQWLFDFQYESPDCENPLIEPFRLSIAGSSLIARSPSSGIDSGSDFKLLLLNQEVPEHYKPFFNGWSRSNSVTTTGTGIHHPQGDIKKISTYLSQPTSTGYSQTIPNPDRPYWRVVWSETETNHGVTEGGSSGSPLFDSNRRIVGTLSGGGASCLNLNAPDYYGKFSYSWNENGSLATQQLQPWLDPDNTGAEFVNGIGVDPNLIFAYFQADATEITLNQSIKFEQQSTGIINQYEWYFEGGNPSHSTAEVPPEITYDHFGSFDVSLIVKNENSADTLVQKDYIKVKPFLYPNPAKDQFILNFGKEIPEEIEVQLYDVCGRKVPTNLTRTGSQVTINLYDTSTGFYLIGINNNDSYQTLKLIIIK